MIKIRGAPTTAERSGDPARREHEAGQQSAQIENPRYVIAPAPARELPGPNLGLADQACVVAGRHVMKIVLEQYRAPSARIREHERDWAQLDPDPVAGVAAVLIESVIPQVAGPRLTQRRARGRRHGESDQERQVWQRLGCGSAQAPLAAHSALSARPR